MEEKLSIQKLKSLKARAVQKVETFISKLINSGDPRKEKKASVLSYWINDYFRFLDKESDFDPRSCIKYRRGDVVKVHLGYKIGSEEGGLHYAVVVDNNNSRSSNTITVIPLTSIRRDRKVHHSSIEIGTEIFIKIMNKYDKTIGEVKDEIQRLERLTPEDHNTADYSSSLQLLLKRVKELELLKKEIHRMKSGSVALVSQITTISKIRIYDPIHTYNVLYGVRLTPTALDKINDKIIELYVFKK